LNDGDGRGGQGEDAPAVFVKRDELRTQTGSVAGDGGQRFGQEDAQAQLAAAGIQNVDAALEAAYRIARQAMERQAQVRSGTADRPERRSGA